ncbi:hypothetical protein [Streptomyces sp. NBC_00859]|uniref:hypothetical protein n=1 Tax=Streptomyces sp. NBC_00859 TaxID=2903682 RepID=UPI00386493F0|nr:hypothetical protein OG584_33965 [Streptomyces sp. NBC_00859]
MEQRKAADALRSGGALATITTEHVAGGSEAFFTEVQDCYERLDPATPPGLRLSTAAGIAPDRAEVDRSGRFGQVAFRRYERDLVYSAAQYLDVLNTYSGHRALEPKARADLFDCIERLIQERHGGRIAKRYLNDLRVAYRSVRPRKPFAFARCFTLRAREVRHSLRKRSGRLRRWGPPGRPTAPARGRFRVRRSLFPVVT